MTDPIAEFNAVSKEYPIGLTGRRIVRAVRGVSFRVEPGEVFGLLGPNRAGKTTLVKILLSLCRPTAGQAMRLGRPVADKRTLARVGYVHENHAFPRYLTAEGLLEYFGALSLLPYDEVQRRTPELLARVGLADRSREPIRGFSKGMAQRLGVAQALLNDPELLVFDEPNEGLDLLGRRVVADVIREHRARGRTVVLVSHVLPEVEQLCDRVAVLLEGELAFLGPVGELTGGRAKSLEDALHALYKRSHA